MYALRQLKAVCAWLRHAVISMTQGFIYIFFNLNSSPEAYTASVEGVCWTEAGPAGAAEAIGES